MRRVKEKTQQAVMEGQKEDKIEEEGWVSEPRVTREDMLQIKSFGTKEDCCQATQPEQGYQGNRDDPKVDLRNGVALVVHQHTHMGTQTHTSALLSVPVAFKVHLTNTNRQKVSPGKRRAQPKCQPEVQTKCSAFNQGQF